MGAFPLGIIDPYVVRDRWEGPKYSNNLLSVIKALDSLSLSRAVLDLIAPPKLPKVMVISYLYLGNLKSKPAVLFLFNDVTGLSIWVSVKYRKIYMEGLTYIKKFPD